MERFLIEKEKQELAKKQKAYVDEAIERSNKTLDKIIKNRLLHIHKTAKSNYNHYLNEIKNTEAEIKEQITKDEASSTKRRLKNWTKIQTLRDKAFNLHYYWQPKVNDSNKSIENFDIIEAISDAKDKDTKKYYSKVFNVVNISEKIVGGFGISFCKALSKVSDFIKEIGYNILTIISCVLLAICVLISKIDIGIIFDSAQGEMFLFLVCAFCTTILFGIVNLILNGYDFKVTTRASIFVYVFYLGWIAFCTITTYGLQSMEYRDIIALIIVILIPWLIRLILCPIRIAGFICNRIVRRHHAAYNQYYSFLHSNFENNKPEYHKTVITNAGEIIEKYFLDYDLFSIPEKAYSSILSMHKTWAKNHAIIPEHDLLTKPSLNYRLIKSKKEKKMSCCDRCGYPHTIKEKTDTREDYSRAKKKVECSYSGGYHETETTTYDIEVDGRKVGTATNNNRYYVPLTLEKEEIYYEIPVQETTYHKCPYCGNRWTTSYHNTKVENEFWYNIHKSR